jgi:hypothetical protein
MGEIVSEPVIPERWRDCYKIGDHDNPCLVLDMCIEELGVAEAKIADLTAKLFIYEEAGRPEWMAEQATTIAELRAEIADDHDAVRTVANECRREDEATIASLAEALARIGKVRTWVLAWRIAREALKDCGKWPDASLGKQVQQ